MHQTVRFARQVDSRPRPCDADTSEPLMCRFGDEQGDAEILAM